MNEVQTAAWHPCVEKRERERKKKVTETSFLYDRNPIIGAPRGVSWMIGIPSSKRKRVNKHLYIHNLFFFLKIYFKCEHLSRSRSAQDLMDLHKAMPCLDHNLHQQ